MNRVSDPYRVYVAHPLHRLPFQPPRGTMSFAAGATDVPIGARLEKKTRIEDRDDDGASPAMLLDTMPVADRSWDDDYALHNYHLKPFHDPVTERRLVLGIHKRLTRRLAAVYAKETCTQIATHASNTADEDEDFLSVAHGYRARFVPCIDLLERINYYLRQDGLLMCAAGGGMHTVYNEQAIAPIVATFLDTDSVPELVARFAERDGDRIAATQWQNILAKFGEAAPPSALAIEQISAYLQSGSSFTIDPTHIQSAERAVSIMCDDVCARPFVGSRDNEFARVVWPDSETVRIAQRTPPRHVREMAKHKGPSRYDDEPEASPAAVWYRSPIAIDTPAEKVRGLVSFTFIGAGDNDNWSTHRMTTVYVYRDCSLLRGLSDDAIQILAEDPGLVKPLTN